MEKKTSTGIDILLTLICYNKRPFNITILLLYTNTLNNNVSNTIISTSTYFNGLI